MPKRERFQTYLVAVKQKREPTRLYALKARSPAEALEIVSGQAAEGVHVEQVGMLNARTAKPYKLKPGDLIII